MVPSSVIPPWATINKAIFSHKHTDKRKIFSALYLYKIRPVQSIFSFFIVIENIRVSSSKLEQESRKFNFKRRSREGPVLSGCRAAPLLLLLLLSLPPPEPEELLFERGYIRARQQPSHSTNYIISKVFKMASYPTNYSMFIKEQTRVKAQ